ncbi:MAG: hypothetical protein CMM01_24690 [Rhodopirellula sp.]|nr:hypothetical protein [Rhodopirellula sp.]
MQKPNTFYFQALQNSYSFTGLSKMRHRSKPQEKVISQTPREIGPLFPKHVHIDGLHRNLTINIHALKTATDASQ